LARRTIYGRPNQPYCRLLDLVGCELGDLERLVHQEGLDGGLRALLERGVYLTIDELKGRAPVQRASTRFTVDPADLVNPLAARPLPSETGGSRGPRMSVPWDLRYLRDEDLAHCLLLESLTQPNFRFANWAPPGATAIMRVLGNSQAG